MGSLRSLLPVPSASIAFAMTGIVAFAVGLPATAIGQTITLGEKVPMFDSGIAVSYVGVPVSITCAVGSGPTQFNFSVTQPPNVTGSFGYIMAQCKGKPETFVVAVQSNSGSLYQEGKAVASVNCFYPCLATASRNVTMFRLARPYFLLQ
jgi:hypothetical protein